MSLVLWEALKNSVLDQDELDWSEPDLNDCLTHGFEEGCRRYERHMYYFATRIQYSVASALVLGITCLEAYANELISLTPGLTSRDRSALLDMRLRDRYQRLSELLSGRKFEETVEPFTSFVQLVRARNAIVHFKFRSAPTGGTPRESSSVAATGSAQRRSDLSIPEDLDDAGLTRWALDTTTAMMTAINGMVTESELCLQPEELTYITAEKWQRQKPGNIA